jgi:hypothetical protein
MFLRWNADNRPGTSFEEGSTFAFEELSDVATDPIGAAWSGPFL